MMVKIEKAFQVQQPVEKVWGLLSNPEQVVTCVPGAQIIERVDERTYKGSVSVKVGPSVSDYRGEVQIVRFDPQTHEIELVGKGQDTRGKGSASLKMTGSVRALPEGGSEVVSVSEISIAGILAQVGSRMINEVSNIMFQQFVTNFQQRLEAPNTANPLSAAHAASATKPIRVFPLALSALWAAIKRLFSRSKG